jgi:hypothetical protein
LDIFRDGLPVSPVTLWFSANGETAILDIWRFKTAKPPNRHVIFQSPGLTRVNSPTRYTSPTRSTIEPSSRPSWKTLQTRENLHIFMRPPCIPLATLLGRLSFWHP